MIEEVKRQVYELLKSDNSGHGIDHIERVLNLSLKLAKKEKADLEIVSLIALLHDVDDHKLFGEENAKNLPNARLFMQKANISEEKQEKVIEVIQNFGYSKAVLGIRPSSLEGMVVSDADMCDVVGVSGIIRTFRYSIKHNKPFFDKNIFPSNDLETTKKLKVCADSSVCHIFEKALKLKKMMLTNSGKKEIEKRHQITIDILYQLFDEENVPEWKEYLDDYLKTN